MSELKLAVEIFQLAVLIGIWLHLILEKRREVQQPRELLGRVADLERENERLRSRIGWWMEENYSPGDRRIRG